MEEVCMTSQVDIPTIPSWSVASPRRRFSEGIECIPLEQASWRVGRFSDGIARSPRTAPAMRIGNFADGLAYWREPGTARRVGSFGDGFVRTGVGRAAVQRVDAPPSSAEDRRAA
jgi:hypothetical protein